MAEVYPNFELPTDLPTTLPVIALRRGVLLPGVARPFLVGRARSIAALDAMPGDLILVAPQREPTSEPAHSDLLPTAVLARVIKRVPNEKNRAERVVLQGLFRVSLTGFPSLKSHIVASYSVIDETWPETGEGDGMRKAFNQEVDDAAEGIPGGQDALKAFSTLPLEQVIDGVATLVGGEEQGWLREILSTHDPLKRADKVLNRLVRVRAAMKAHSDIKDRVQSATRDQQREFFLRQQLKAIRTELGEGKDGSDEMTRLRERLDESDLPEEVREVVNRELRRLERLSANSPDRGVAVDWLEWIADMPWAVWSGVDVDLGSVEEALDASHFGLLDVKKQVVEHLAVRKLAGSGRADVLLLVGPPGVGKTSIGQAIADATGRKLVRVALGGVRDEAELRGHRRTYIGARPGRLIEGIRRAGTADPVVLLDEVDKLGTGSWGNPASALLEILDPEQNHSFTDRYLEVPYDLSKVLFIATANDLSKVPGPLRDRMQVLHIEGYTQSEKVVIAKNHLLDLVAKNAGLDKDDVVFTDAALEAAVNKYTRESGVRELQRVLGKVYRAAAVKRALGELAEPLAVDASDLETYLGKVRVHEEPREVNDDRTGLVTGLAWTPFGGTVLYVEASKLPGRGQLILTGQLGDVMKESARAALTYALSNADDIGIDRASMTDADLHIHVPAGGTPKDGPSAGVTMFTAIASLLSGRAVRSDVAMTGEATLRGRVLPVGGIKSKVLAAHRHGVKTVILPRRNGNDLDDIPEEVRSELNIVLVDHMEEVIEIALKPVKVDVQQSDSEAA